MERKTLQDFKNQVKSEHQEMYVPEDVINFISTVLYITYLEQQLKEADEKLKVSLIVIKQYMDKAIKNASNHEIEQLLKDLEKYQIQDNNKEVNNGK